MLMHSCQVVYLAFRNNERQKWSSTLFSSTSTQTTRRRPPNPSAAYYRSALRRAPAKPCRAKWRSSISTRRALTRCASSSRDTIDSALNCEHGFLKNKNKLTNCCNLFIRRWRSRRLSSSLSTSSSSLPGVAWHAATLRSSSSSLLSSLSSSTSTLTAFPTHHRRRLAPQDFQAQVRLERTQVDFHGPARVIQVPDRVLRIRRRIGQRRDDDEGPGSAPRRGDRDAPLTQRQRGGQGRVGRRVHPRGPSRLGPVDDVIAVP